MLGTKMRKDVSILTQRSSFQNKSKRASFAEIPSEATGTVAVEDPVESEMGWDGAGARVGRVD